MGQKTNPTLLRLNKTNQHWNSCWYSDSDYATQFLEDCKINAYIKNCSQQLKKIPPILFIKRQRGDLQIAFFSTKLNQFYKRGAFFERARASKFPFHSNTKTCIPFPVFGEKHPPLPQILKMGTNLKKKYPNFPHTACSSSASFGQKASSIGSPKDAGRRTKVSGDLLSTNVSGYAAASKTQDKKEDIEAIVSSGKFCRRFSHAFLSFLFTRELATPTPRNSYLTKMSTNFFATKKSKGNGAWVQRYAHEQPVIQDEDLSARITGSIEMPGQIASVAPVNVPTTKIYHLPTASLQLSSLWRIPPTDRKGGPETKLPLKNHMECSLYNGTQLKSKIHLLRCPSIHQNPFFLAGQIVFLLQERVTFRRLKHRIIEETRKDGNIKGVRITCSGRVAARSKKAQKARTDSIQWGATSLNIFSEYLAFASCYAQTTFGKVGVKVWICYEKEKIENQRLTIT